MCASKYFNMGNLVVTSGIYEAMKESKRFTLDVGICLQRYGIKDWGDLSEEDKRMDDEALMDLDDLYILAAYQTCRGRVCIITNRISENPGDNATTICFSDER